jgi:hypothetical protein
MAIRNGLHVPIGHIKKKVMNPQSVVILKEGLKMSRFFHFNVFHMGTCKIYYNENHASDGSLN